jgi:ATP-dependent RNA helicase DHX37/DHR1
VEDDSNALLLQPRQKEAGSVPDDGPAPARKLSKAQKRKRQKVQEEKTRRAERAQVLASLAEHELPAAHLALLTPTTLQGQVCFVVLLMEQSGQVTNKHACMHACAQRETKRQKLRHGLALQRLGHGVPADARLHVERPAEEGPEPAVRQPSPAAAEAPPADSSSSSSEEEGEVHQDEAGSPAAVVELSAEEQRAAVQRIRQQLGVALDEIPTTPSPAQAGPARIITVTRPAGMEEARRGLPVLGMEQEIMEAVAGADVVLLCGETGSGKTTQVPQFLLEAGYGAPRFPERAGRVGVTQPRRVAAVAAAQRVAQELGCALGGPVGYHVRHDARWGARTALKFMTDGILLRELQADLLLRAYSAIVLDEAHERSLNTDLLLGLLSRVVPLRRQVPGVGPLKLLIMSATLRVEDFAGNARLFPAPPPIVRVPARQYPVTVHFARRTELHDYLGAAFGKVLLFCFGVLVCERGC